MKEQQAVDFMSRRDVIGTSLVLGGFSALPALAGSKRVEAGSVFEIQEGRLLGLQTEHLDVLLGVRYGESTAGANRFSPPRAARPWSGIRKAWQLAHQAPQNGPDTGPWLDMSAQSEDCLFLNVWAPRKQGSRPVMVFFHGGGYAYGSGGVPMYNGASLAERGDVVVVTVNHRLNLFGYLYLSELSEAYGRSANAGHQDLLEALRWVQRNISAFGGDPANVTIFGESGGGAKVNLMLATPAARGLFAKAIVQSGSALKIRAREVADAEARSVLAELRIGASEVHRLSTAPYSALVRAYRSVAERVPVPTWKTMPFSPVEDGYLIPAQPDQQAAQSLWRDVPLLVGTTRDESILFINGGKGVPALDSDASLISTLANAEGLSTNETALLVKAFSGMMPAATREQLYVAVATYRFVGKDAVRQAELKASARAAPVFMYRFDWADPCFGGRWAPHAVDLPFVFDKLDATPLWDGTDTARLRAKADTDGLRFRLRDTVIAAWSNFARGGTPATPLLPDWPPFDPAGRAVMSLSGNPVLLHDLYGAEIRMIPGI